MAQISAGVASFLSSLVKLGGYRRRLLVAVGIGTIFKAPLGEPCSRLPRRPR